MTLPIVEDPTVVKIFDTDGSFVPPEEPVRIAGEWTCALLPVLVVAVLVAHKRRPASGLVLVARLALALYLCRLLALVYFPWPNPFDSASTGAPSLGLLEGHNFTLFRTVQGTWPDTFVRQIGGNLALLFPLGVLAPLAFERFRSVRPLLSLVVGVAIVIEGSHLLVRHRLFDVDDLWLNAVGGLVGAGAWVLGRTTAARIRHRPDGDRSDVELVRIDQVGVGE